MHTPMALFNKRKRAHTAHTTLPDFDQATKRQTVQQCNPRQYIPPTMAAQYHQPNTNGFKQSFQKYNSLELIPPNFDNSAYKAKNPYSKNPAPTLAPKKTRYMSDYNSINMGTTSMRNNGGQRPTHIYQNVQKPSTINDSCKYTKGTKNFQPSHTFSAPTMPSEHSTPLQKVGKDASQRNAPTVKFGERGKQGLILCSTIADVGRCTAVNKTGCPIMFEIFGALDSNVTSSGTSRKQFALKDDTGRINCVFHEIDRPLPALVRSTTYRCMGSYSVSKECLSCVSIRGVKHGEMKLTQAMRDLTDRVITTLSMSRRET